MAKLKIVDTARGYRLYADLDTGLGHKESMAVGHNTLLVRHEDGTIALRLHATDVATVKSDGTVTFTTGGWVTVTTIERINHVAGLLGYRAYRVKGEARLGLWKDNVLTWVPLDGARCLHLGSRGWDKTDV